MSTLMDEEIKRWTARRKTALVLDIIQGKTTVVEASRAYDLTPSEVESWVEDGKKGMENALKANPLDIHSQYERQIKDLQEAYGEAMLELRARNVPLVWRTPAHVLLQNRQGPAEAAGAACGAGQGHDRGEPFLWIQNRSGVAGHEQEYGAAHLPDQGLAGP